MQKKSKIRLSPFLVNIILLAIISLSFFLQQKEAVDKSLRFAPLANGWVSHYAVLHLRPISLVDKYNKTVADDLVHGRYRPSSHLITTISYALSPLFHERLGHGEKRPYRDLVTGDLAIMSNILLSCMVLSVAALSFVIVKYTGNFLLLFFPILFIPLSPALTENLVQFHVDSQEIQLIFYISLWASFFFIGLLAKNNFARISLLVLSMLFLAMSFMAKETSIVLLPIITVLFMIMLIIRLNQNVDEEIENWPLVITGLNLLISAACAIMLYLLVIQNRTKYGTGYSTANFENLKENLSSVLYVLGASGINPYICLLTIGIALILLIYHRKSKINNISITFHITLLLFFLLAASAFSLIIVPWEVILSKYLLPAIVFIYFALCYSLITIAKLLPVPMGRIWLAIVLAGTVMLYGTFFRTAKSEMVYYYERAGYGTSIVNLLVDKIAERIAELPGSQANIFVEYGTAAAWGAFVPWGRLQLQRKLNIDKKFNLIDKNGLRLFNTYMPDEECTSYRFEENQKTLYLTNGRKELRERRFQLVYKGYPVNEIAPELLTYVVQEREISYKLANEAIHYKSKANLPGFILYLYLPVVQ